MLAALALIALPAVADEVARLHALFDKNWETRLRESPTFATSVGGGQAVMRNFANGINYGASDPRKDGAAIPQPLLGK